MSAAGRLPLKADLEFRWNPAESPGRRAVAVTKEWRGKVQVTG